VCAYLFTRKEFGLSAYWSRNAELLASVPNMRQNYPQGVPQARQNWIGAGLSAAART